MSVKKYTSTKHLEPLVVILGPTASGKTELAIKLAKKFKGEIVCADSRTIYKEMDIGTAKPLQNQKLKIKNKKYKSKFKNIKALEPTIIRGVPHYMIDVVRPDQEFTVAQFKEQAIKIIKDIQKRNRIPFLVGGAGLYISAIVDNLEIPRVPPGKKLRAKLEKQAKKYSSNYLYQKLLKIDPQAKNFVQKENLRRVIRALEVCLTTKRPFSQLRQRGEPMFNVLQVGIKIPRQQLYQNINKRVDQMIKMGLAKETKKLAKKYSWHLPAMSGLGYRQIGLYLRRKIDRDGAIELIKQETRRYAKRQMTWFKRDKRIHWVSPGDLGNIQKLINSFI